jgi:glyoxylase-like metal-dependent hydrolase (beta-lactamase superfamily II)
MKIGLYQIHSLETGRFGLDGGAMFGVVPKTLWSRTNPSDDKNRIQMAARVLLIASEERKILVDVGIGHKFPPKYQEIYHLDYGQYSLRGSLAQHGISPEEITDVILTHCHFDHAGGSTELVGDTLKPTFPAATYYVQRSHWDWALRPSEKDHGSFLFFNENVGPVEASGKLKILNGSCELFPGVRLVLANGHTPGLQMVKIQDQSTTLFYCGDLMPTSSHVRLPYIMAYDLHPLKTLEEKRFFLNEAWQEDWIIALEHDPQCEAIRVKKGEKAFEIKERLTI